MGLNSLYTHLLLVVIVFCDLTKGAKIFKSITVDQAGHGDFTTIQAAVNSIPDGNADWIRIHINRGTYREKVTVPILKEHIFLEGEGPKLTKIEWNDRAEQRIFGEGIMAATDTMGSATFAAFAANFVARGISFANTYNRNTQNPLRQAIAALVGGDKSAFYNCEFLGKQDTLCDYAGRHYFSNCWIEGSIDFVFGFGQSIYESCTLYTRWVGRGGRSFITAQGRYDPNKPGGFVFKSCNILGQSKTYLGRAYGNFSTVIFYKTQMSTVVVPHGWYAWTQKGHENRLTYVEDSCTGPGANHRARVKWRKQLSAADLASFTNIRFIDDEEWLNQQP